MQACEQFWQALMTDFRRFKTLRLHSVRKHGLHIQHLDSVRSDASVGAVGMRMPFYARTGMWEHCRCDGSSTVPRFLLYSELDEECAVLSFPDVCCVYHASLSMVEELG